MDHIRLVRADLAFAPYSFSHQLNVPFNDGELIQDIELQFWGEPGNYGPQVGMFPSDIRVYVNEYDLTEHILAELLDALAERDESAAEYHSAMQEWFEIARQMGTSYGSPNLEEEQAVIDQLSQESDFSILFSEFGKATGYGWGGAFHPFNFIFKKIRISPISMRAVIDRHNKSNPDKTIEPLDAASAIFCTGLKGEVPDPLIMSRGRLQVFAELRYHNTLRDRVIEIEKQLDELRKQVLAELELISDSLGPNGDLQISISDLEKEVQSIRDDLGISTLELKSHTQQLTAIKSAASELKNAVSRL